VATDAAGDVWVAGFNGGAIDLGGGPLGAGTFVAKLDGNGDHLWSTSFAGPEGAVMNARLAVAGNGDVVIAGYFQGQVDFGGGALVSDGGYDVFVVKLDSAGNHLWSQRFGDVAPEQRCEAVAVEPDGSVALTGTFFGTLDFGGGPLVADVAYDVFVAKLDAGGGHVWSKRFGTSGSEVGWAVATSIGRVTIGGNLASNGPVDFGGGALPGSARAFVAQFDASGAHVWSLGLSASTEVFLDTLAADDDGNVVFGGGYSGLLTGLAAEIQSTPSFDDAPDVFLAKHAPDGTGLWVRTAGTEGDDWVTSIASHPSGDVVATGYGCPLPLFPDNVLCNGSEFLLWLDPSGDFRGGDAFDAELAPAIIEPSGDLVLAGRFSSSSIVDFGGGALPGAGMLDACAARLTPMR
jgi:hypothetical protein